MKVVFLDVDGVLATWDTIRRDRKKPGPYGFDRGCVERLNEILHRSGAQLVLSSTWRIIHSLDEFNAHARSQGVTASVISATPSLGTVRGKEIKAWLLEHPEVDKYAIIDDDSDMDDIKSHLIHVKNGMEKGLQDKHVAEALSLLAD